MPLFSHKVCKPETYTRTILIFIIFSLLLGVTHFCQSSTNINGKVIDRETGQPILGAVVKVEAGGQTLAETTTEEDGSFHLAQDVQGEKTDSGQFNRI